MSFEVQRRAFDILRTQTPKNISDEYVEALRALIHRFPTSIRENRFIAGGAVELLTCGLLRAVGVDCEMRGDNVGGGIVLAEHPDAFIAVNSSFVGGPQSIGILNKQGTGSREWTVPIFFVLAEVGIVYGDRGMVQPGELKDKPDQLELPKQVLEGFIGDPNNVFPLQIVRKPATIPPDAEVMSRGVARLIVQERNLMAIQGALPPP